MHLISASLEHSHRIMKLARKVLERESRQNVNFPSASDLDVKESKRKICLAEQSWVRRQLLSHSGRVP